MHISQPDPKKSDGLLCSIHMDRYAITIDDPGHSDDEYRYIDIGFSSEGRILVVW